MRDSNLSKTFHLDISKEGLENEFNGNRQNIAVIFILAIVMIITVEVVKRYKKMWDENSQMFLLGSLSGIAVLGDVIREYLPMNLILLFVFINMGVVLLRVYLRKKFEYM